MHPPTFHHKYLSTLACLALSALAATTGEGWAGDASEWKREKHAAARLIGGGQVTGTTPQFYRAGIEIKLSPGWKTYWRYPGDSGVPPRFDFNGSRNLKDAAILWPAPFRFADAGGTSIGYKEGVIFPLRITPVDPAQPVMLKLAMDYAICEKLCVLAEARLELNLDREGAAHHEILATSERLVPKRMPLGAAGPVAVQAVHVDRKGPPRVTVTISAPEGAKADLFAEGPGNNWSLPVPEPLGDQTGTSRQFTFGLEGLPPGVSSVGATLTLTTVANGSAIEVAAPLD